MLEITFRNLRTGTVAISHVLLELAVFQFALYVSHCDSSFSFNSIHMLEVGYRNLTLVIVNKLSVYVYHGWVHFGL